MKIVHICISNHFTENMAYQENYMSEIQAKDGNDVYIIAEAFAFEGAQVVHIGEERKTLKYGERLIRLEYKEVLNHKITMRLKILDGLYDELVSISPDIIYFHEMLSLSLLDVGKYLKKHKKIKFFTDHHATFEFLNINQKLRRRFLFNIVYRYAGKSVEKYITKSFFVSEDCKILAKKLHKLPDKLLEYLPLGGDIVDKSEKEQCIARVRARHSVKSGDLLLLASGKFEKRKNIKELLVALKTVKSENIKLLLIGSFENDVKKEVCSMIEQDRRVEYLGWKSADELREYLCGVDLYLQPGSPSATLQNALCCATPAAVYPYNFYTTLLCNSVFYIKNVQDIVEVINEILIDRSTLNQKSKESFKIACEKLDNEKISRRIYDF